MRCFVSKTEEIIPNVYAAHKGYIMQKIVAVILVSCAAYKQHGMERPWENRIWEERATFVEAAYFPNSKELAFTMTDAATEKTFYITLRKQTDGTFTEVKRTELAWKQSKNSSMLLELCEK